MQKVNQDPNLVKLINYLGGICALCHKPYPDKKSWLIHHRRYPKGEKSSKDFKTKYTHIITRGKRKGKKTKKTLYDQKAYYTYLLPKVLEKKDPTYYYVPIHNKCHQAVSRLAWWSENNLDRLYELAREQK